MLKPPSKVKSRIKTHYRADGQVDVIVEKRIGSTFYRAASGTFKNEAEAKKFGYDKAI